MSSSPKGIDSINATLAGTGYSCKFLSLDTIQPKQSSDTATAPFCFGQTNITDVYLKAKDDTPLYTLRRNKWKDGFLEVSINDVALLTGNCDGAGELHDITLRQFLQEPAEMGAGYTGLHRSTSLTAFPDVVNVRFETVFFPMKCSDDARADMQFAVETSSKAVQSEDDPRNLIVLASTKGLSVEADATNAKKIMLHMGSKNEGSEYWFKVQTPMSKNGGQKDANDEAESKRIGIKGLKTRSNELMTIQVPLVQKSTIFGSKPVGRALANAEQIAPSTSDAPSVVKSDSAVPPKQVSDTLPTSLFDSFASNSLPNETRTPDTENISENVGESALSPNLCAPSGGQDLSSSPFDIADGDVKKNGISRGDFHAKHNGLSERVLKRNWEKATVTFMIIKTAVGVPTEADVAAAFADMEVLYAWKKASLWREPVFTFSRQDASGLFISQHNKKLPVPRNHLASRSVLMSSPPVSAHAVPSASSKLLRLQRMKIIVTNTFKDFERVQTIPASELLELKLLTFGVVQSEEVKNVLETKFEILTEISWRNSDLAKQVLLELELFVLGSFDLLKRDVLRKESSAA